MQCTPLYDTPDFLSDNPACLGKILGTAFPFAFAGTQHAGKRACNVNSHRTRGSPENRKINPARDTLQPLCSDSIPGGATLDTPRTGWTCV